MPRVHPAAPVLAGLLLLSACASPVEVTPAPAATAPGCAAMAASWPAQVEGGDRTGTRPDDPSTAAWTPKGGPAIIARCGVPVPGPTSSECIAVDDVDWISERLEDGVRFTTYGRDPALEVLVPDHYAPEPMALTAFGEVAKKGTPTGHRCS